ncbi:atrial natriuretic peptide receptor 1-like [Branchiostoma floridae]|uniref:Guanylate cyclase n=1 Tax=Branchiostoma floridae TaxID=7739 RepID=A0A9J7L254_BRAFL|nr:atrial natriuretic peptide receptor 1-like [Branchiostoma floridae]
MAVFSVYVRLGFLVAFLSFAACRDFKLGLLIPQGRDHRLYGWESTASATSIAIDRVMRDPSLLPGHTLSVVWRDSSCNSKVAAGAAVELAVQENVDALLAPPCAEACIQSSQLAAYWNMPTISWLPVDPQLENKALLKTLARTFVPSNKFGVAVVELLKLWSWKRIGIFSDSGFLCKSSTESVKQYLAAANITLAGEYSYDIKYLDPQLISEKLRILKQNARIIYMCHPSIPVERAILLQAHELEMTSGDYVLINAKLSIEVKVDQPWSSDDGRNADAIRAYESVLEIGIKFPNDPAAQQVREDIPKRMAQEPWNYRAGLSLGLKGGFAALYLHDAVLLYAVALNATLAAGEDPRDGGKILQHMKGAVFKGVSGYVVMDRRADREPEFMVWDMAPNGKFEVVAEYGVAVNGQRTGLSMQQVSGQLMRMVQLRAVDWGSGKTEPPADAPKCGFRGEFCTPRTQGRSKITVIVSVVGGLLLVVGGVAAYYQRKKNFEADLSSMSWRMNYDDIDFSAATKQLMSQMSIKSKTTSGSRSHGTGAPSKTTASLYSGKKSQRAPPQCGRYEGNFIAMKNVRKLHVQIDREQLLEFKEALQVNHGNLNRFIGACVEAPHICLVYEFCPKGSLQDILENDDIKLDNMFKLSLLSDVVKGMEYLHRCPVLSHGSLRSNKCLIDNRWMVKITDFGMARFKANQSENPEVGEHEEYMKLLWTAPELLRMPCPPLKGTQKGDVYSFAIITQEVISRGHPYCGNDSTPRDIVERVRMGTNPPVRPIVDEEGATPEVYKLMVRCWSEVPEARPDFTAIRKIFRKCNKGRDANVMDNMIVIMEKYAANLESIVADRTKQLVEEQKKTDKLLHSMLPRTVADELKQGRVVSPEMFDQSTVFFSDIIGFSTIAAQSTPFQIVDLLNDLYSCFDGIIEQHHVYKVETVNDSYMVVSGIPDRNKDHVDQIATMSLNLLSEAAQFTIRHLPSAQLLLRIGIHTGPCAAGVVGLSMPRYCLFGDTVNTASRMESNGKALRIHVSSALKQALDEMGGFKVEHRGQMEIKGKGMQDTFWLVHKQGFHKPLPMSPPEDLVTGGIVPKSAVTFTFNA